MSVTISLRSLHGFAAGIIVAGVGLFMFHSLRADAIGANETTFVPIAPCRLLDTRPAPDNIGARSGPLAENTPYSLQVTGNNGKCSIPADATGVAINLTGVAPTAATFVSIYPDNVSNPGTSVLNMLPGQSPSPNKVDIKLSPDGKVKLFNRFGTVHIVGDVLGYYRSDGLADLEARVADLEAQSADVDTQLAAVQAAQPFSVHGFNVFEAVTSDDVVVVSVDVTAPVAGHVVVNSSLSAAETTAGEGVRCSLTTGATIDFDSLQAWESPGSLGDSASLAGTKRFDIAAGATVTYNLVCDHFGASADSVVNDTWLTAIFTPAP